MKPAGIVGLVLSAALLRLSFSAEAQQPVRPHRIGYLTSTSPSTASISIDAFRQGLKELGYIEGKNIIIEYRFAEESVERVPTLAAELVRLKVDVIMTAGPGAEAAKSATKTIPIVITDVADPVATGLVASLAHPGGNVTGFSALGAELAGKWLELLKEAFPKVSLVAVLCDTTNPNNALILKEAKVAADALRVTLQPHEVRGPNDFEPTFSTLRKTTAAPL